VGQKALPKPDPKLPPPDPKIEKADKA